MRSKGIWLGLGLAVWALALAGCGQVKVSQVTSAGATPMATAPSRAAHDLAILGAEINPSLEAALKGNISRTAFQLLVAVENRGTEAERDVIVEAWLRASGQKGEAAILSGRSIIPYVSPGEVALAKLSASGSVPVLPGYTLTVSVRPVPKEGFTGNNTSRYEISVSLPQF